MDCIIFDGFLVYKILMMQNSKYIIHIEEAVCFWEDGKLIFNVAAYIKTCYSLGRIEARE